MRKQHKQHLNIHNFKIRKVQDRKGSPWVLLPRELFKKGDLVVVSQFDSDTAVISKRIPGRSE